MSNRQHSTKLDATGKTVFEDIYTAPDPRPYCQTMQALDYAIPEQAQPMFSELFADYREQSGKQSVRVLDLGSSYGINAALLKHDLGLPALYQRYTTEDALSLTTDELLARDRQDYGQITNNHLDVVGFDISAPALDYATQAGLLLESIEANLERDDLTRRQQHQLAKIDCIISSGCIGYVTTQTLEKILIACAPARPWMGHCVLRMFSLDGLTALLHEFGYEMDILPEPVKQRRFASIEEQTRVLSSLIELGVDTEGYEDQGWLYAWLIRTKPKIQ